jgi:hypothetical protein
MNKAIMSTTLQRWLLAAVSVLPQVSGSILSPTPPMVSKVTSQNDTLLTRLGVQQLGCTNVWSE